ncbi:MAG: hypothetical protein Q9227_004586 [Pyrenula ochraceoflavens]
MSASKGSIGAKKPSKTIVGEHIPPGAIDSEGRLRTTGDHSEDFKQAEKRVNSSASHSAAGDTQSKGNFLVPPQREDNQTTLKKGMDQGFTYDNNSKDPEKFPRSWGSRYGEGLPPPRTDSKDKRDNQEARPRNQESDINSMDDCVASITSGPCDTKKVL